MPVRATSAGREPVGQGVAAATQDRPDKVGGSVQTNPGQQKQRPLHRHVGGLARSPRSTKLSAASEGGFTLIEILLVIVVLGLAMGLVATSGPMRSQAIEMQAVVQQIAQSARLARSRAIAENRAVRLVLDVPAHSLRIDGASPTWLPPTMHVSMTSVTAESISGVLSAIRFNPDGSSTGGRIELAEGSRRALIGVDWLTSRVSIVQPK